MLDLLVQNLIQALTLVLAGILATAVAAAARIAIKFLKSKLTAEQYGFLKEGATTVVRYIEQTSAWNSLLADGAAKKEAALLQLTAWAEGHGVPLTYDLADRIIEEAVNIMNSELAEIEVIEE